MDGVPDGLEAAARRLSADAAAIRLRGDALLRPAAGMRWQGGAADAFRRALADDRTRLHRAADELDEAATALRSHAARVRARIEQLRELERAATRRLQELRDLVDLP